MPAAPAFVPHTDTPGLLAVPEPQTAPKAAAEPADAAKSGPAPAADKTGDPAPAAAAAPPQPLSYVDAPLVLPEGVQFDPERVAALDGILGPAQVPADVRQQLAGLHIAEMQRYAADLQTKTLADQHKAFAETRAGWRRQVAEDPEIGGAAMQTSQAAAIRMLEYFTPADERRALNEALMATGMCDHPQFVRLLVRLARKFDEPAAPAAAPLNPPPDLGRAGRPSGRGGRAADHYDHPSSQAVRR